MGDSAKLLRMVDQIAANLRHEADPGAAVIGHLQTFWSPEMLAKLAETYAVSQGGIVEVEEWLAKQKSSAALRKETKSSDRRC